MSRYHAINLAVLKAFQVDLLDGITAASHFNEPQNISIPKIEFFDHKYKELIASDNKTGLMLKQIAEAANNNKKLFETLSDPILMGKLDVPSGINWSMYVGIGIIVLLIIAIIGIYCKIIRPLQVDNKEFRKKQMELEKDLFDVLKVVKEMQRKTT